MKKFWEGFGYRLVGSSWFRLGICVVYLLGLAGWLATERFWRATPAVVRPELRISVWDAVGAWRWQGKAKRQEAAGRFEEALLSWRLAVKRHPSVGALRGLMRLQAAVDPQDWNWWFVGQDCMRLLELTRTNLADLELVARALNRNGLGRWTIDVLDGYGGDWSDGLDREYLRALCLQGRVEDFARWGERIGGKRDGEGEMRLFRAAYLAGWGGPAEAVEGLALLEAAKRKRETEVLAHRLSLFVDYVRLDVERYRRSLYFLARRKADLLSCHVNYWNLLAGLGQKEKAFWLATRYFRRLDSRRFSNSMGEGAMVAEAFMNMGSEGRAFEYLRRLSGGLGGGFMEDWRLRRADYLMAKERWRELGELALSIRRDRRAGEAMRGYSFFWEGVSEMERGREGVARKAFERIGDYSLEEGRRGLFVASYLFQFRLYDVVRDVLMRLRDRHKDKTVFWRLLFVTAREIGASRELWIASENLYRLRPHDAKARNDYVAALLSLRIRFEEAMLLTGKGMRQNPHDAAGKIHRARALLWAERVDEVSFLLDSINEKRLIGAIEQSFYLARLELEFQRGRVAEAHKWSGKIRPKHLLPGDRRRFREIGDQLAEVLFRRDSGAKLAAKAIANP